MTRRAMQPERWNEDSQILPHYFLDQGPLKRIRALSSRIGIIRCIQKALSRQPGRFFIILRDVDPLNFKDDRSGAVIAAGNHPPVIIGPSFHDRAALESRVNISADSVPRFAAEPAVHQVIKIILLRRALEQKGIPYIEKRARAGLGISQVLFLIFRKAFFVNDRDSAFVPHWMPPSAALPS